MASRDDVELAVAAGVDAVGFIFAPSPRRLSPEDAASLIARVPLLVATVAVFVDPDPELTSAVAAVMPRMLPQFCGSESRECCEGLAPGGYLKVIHIGEASTPERLGEAIAEHPRALPLFDTKLAERAGGGGRVFDWSLVASHAAASMIAGGLRPENVAECIRRLRPFAVDVRSGVERDGRKDRAALAAFLAAVREADAEEIRELQAREAVRLRRKEPLG
jgi:phosphoribosylanthranilate isomerase